MFEDMNRIAAFFDADFRQYDEDLGVLQAYARRTGGPLLELGCGTGRALIPLARAGFKVTGVDISPEMLRIAGEKVKAAGLHRKVTLIQGDYTETPATGSFKFAFTLMNTFMHLLTQADQLRALGHWRDRLAPDGTLLIDVFHPNGLELAGLDGRVEWDKSWTNAETGATIMKLMARTVDLAEQVVHVTHIYDEVSVDGQVHRTLAAFDLRYLWRFEAELLLDRSGFDLEAIFGDWQLGPFESDSDRMILVARRRD